MEFIKPLRESRRITYGIILGVWSIVALYAILHDQYIVRISPEHFTVYHHPLWGIEDPYWLAAAYAFLASFSPGLLLGVTCLFTARVGNAPKISVGYILKGVMIVVVLTELVAASAGLYVYRSKQGIYPDSWYPEKSVSILVTQTIQVTCYLSAALFSGMFVLFLIYTRNLRLKFKGGGKGEA